jgi:hypothetical protein
MKSAYIGKLLKFLISESKKIAYPSTQLMGTRKIPNLRTQTGLSRFFHVVTNVLVLRT